MFLNLFEVLPDTFIQESLATRSQYQNLASLYELDNEVRLSLLDLLRLNKLKFFYGIVYSCGYNEYGQLGTGNINDEEIPTPIDFSSITDRAGKQKKVIQVSARGAHSLILCDDGTVYSFGSNDTGQLGNIHIGSTIIPVSIDTSNMDGKRVIQVSAGGAHSLILCEDGSVYSFGSNSFGQLGTGNTDSKAIPTPINTSNMLDVEGQVKRVIQVTAGGLYSLILCEDGSVLSFGWDRFGRLGNGTSGDTDRVAIPTPINTTNIGSKRVIQVSAGDDHSLILCENGSVYSFGSNYRGQLGNGTSSSTNNVSIPAEINTTNIGNKRVIQVSAGVLHSLILGEDGTVFSFGWNRYGQLGTGNTYNKTIPTPIDTSNMLDKEGKKKRIIQVSAGDYYSLILHEDGFVYSFGAGETGQLGTGNTDNVSIPTSINATNIGSKRVIQVSAGGEHSLILT